MSVMERPIRRRRSASAARPAGERGARPSSRKPDGEPASDTPGAALGRAERRYAIRLAATVALLSTLLIGAIGLARGRADLAASAVSPAPAPARRAAATAPRCADESRSDLVAVIAQAPGGVEVALDSPITVTFSCPLDPTAVERAFTIYPPTRGTFSWHDRTLVFTPEGGWRPLTTYRVSLFAGLSDSRGFVNGRKVSWPFVTRAIP